MKKHINKLRTICDNTEAFDEGQSQFFSDLVNSTTEHDGRFTLFTEDFTQNEKSQKTEKTQENQR